MGRVNRTRWQCVLIECSNRVIINLSAWSFPPPARLNLPYKLAFNRRWRWRWFCWCVWLGEAAAEFDWDIWLGSMTDIAVDALILRFCLCCCRCRFPPLPTLSPPPKIPSVPSPPSVINQSTSPPSPALLSLAVSPAVTSWPTASSSPSAAAAGTSICTLIQFLALEPLRACCSVRVGVRVRVRWVEVRNRWDELYDRVRVGKVGELVSELEWEKGRAADLSLGKIDCDERCRLRWMRVGFTIVHKTVVCGWPKLHTWVRQGIMTWLN